MSNKHKEDKKIFRTVALEHYSRASQFEQFFLPIEYNKWILIASLFSLFIAGLIWLYCGSCFFKFQGIGITVTDEKNQKIIYGYIPLEMGKKIQINEEVWIELTHVNSREYGAILGNIVSISSHAMSSENLAQRFDNPTLIRYFMQKHDAVLEVIIELQRDFKTISSYRWSSVEGAPIQLSNGILCTFRGFVADKRGEIN